MGHRFLLGLVVVIEAAATLNERLYNAELRKIIVDDASAVCNDGTPGVFYFAAGDPKVWLIDLEGGGALNLPNPN